MKDILNAINSAIIAPTRNIGLGSKSYGFMEKMLHSSIGSSLFSFDSYGSIIGTRANPYMNSETDPWFMLDKERQKYSDYLSYINNTYFYGTMAPPNFGKTGNMLSMLEYSALLQENSYVGALHHFDMDNIMGANLLIPNGATNPNGYDDTRLGVINNYYLSNTLYNSLNAALNRSYSSYYTQTIKSEIENDSESFSVTKGAYSSFGLMGPYGIKNGTFSARDGMVASNSQYIGNILTDYEVSFGKKSAFNERDEVLIDASGDKTREFIAKSMYGFDLLDNIDDIASFLEGNVNNINERSNKKYFPTKSGGYDYISSMCDSWDVSYLWRY
jgi:hypothetical protein